MKYLLIIVPFFVSGCLITPIRTMDINAQTIPPQGEKSISISVKSRDKNTADSFRKALITTFRQSGMREKTDNKESTRIDADVRFKREKHHIRNIYNGYLYGLRTDLILKTSIYPKGSDSPFLKWEEQIQGMFQIQGFDKYKTETPENLKNRAASYLLHVYNAVRNSKNTTLEGEWIPLEREDTFGNVLKISKTDNEYMAKEGPSELKFRTSNITAKFDKDKYEAELKEAYKIELAHSGTEPNSWKGSYKGTKSDFLGMHFTKQSREPRWLPAEFHVFGCLLVVKPESAQVDDSIYIKRCS